MTRQNTDGGAQADFWTRALTGSKLRQFTPAELQLAAIEYFQWCNDNPLYETDLRTADGVVVETPVAKVRAFTIRGLLLYLNMPRGTWDGYTADPLYREATESIMDVIYTQKFENAAAGLLNPTIIARDLGLAEKNDHTSSDGSMTPQVHINTSLMSDEAMQQFLDATKTIDGDESPT